MRAVAGGGGAGLDCKERNAYVRKEIRKVNFILIFNFETFLSFPFLFPLQDAGCRRGKQKFYLHLIKFFIRKIRKVRKVFGKYSESSNVVKKCVKKTEKDIYR
jgi:hypothetical protein